MDFLTAVRSGLRNYARFGGRARRSEYWYLYLFLWLCFGLAAGVDHVLATPVVLGLGWIQAVTALVTLLPGVAACARRLHDRGRSGWWQIGIYLPAVLAVLLASVLEEHEDAMSDMALRVVGAFGLGCIAFTVASFLVVLVWTVRAGERGKNRFGPDPKAPPVAA